MVLIAGVIAIATAFWLWNNFVSWLNILNCTLPPIGALIVGDFFTHKDYYMSDTAKINNVNWNAIIAEVCGSLTGMLFGGYLISGFSWGVPSIFAMIVALVIYFALGGAKPKEA